MREAPPMRLRVRQGRGPRAAVAVSPGESDEPTRLAVPLRDVEKPLSADVPSMVGGGGDGSCVDEESFGRTGDLNGSGESGPPPFGRCKGFFGKVFTSRRGPRDPSRLVRSPRGQHDFLRRNRRATVLEPGTRMATPSERLAYELKNARAAFRVAALIRHQRSGNHGIQTILLHCPDTAAATPCGRASAERRFSKPRGGRRDPSPRFQQTVS